MNGFTDIHTHILPGVDDGAQDIGQAMRLLRLAWKNGTRTVILTPHYRGKYKENTPNQLKTEFEMLQELAKDEFPGLQLYLGHEVAFEVDAPQAVNAGKVMSLNHSRYMLLEFKTNVLRTQIINGVMETFQCGFIPVVAHVERYDISRTDDTLIEELLEMGALLQLNADSVMGVNGGKIKRFCHKLLKFGAVHFVASDAHDQKYRPPLLRKAFMKIYKKYGQEYAAALFYDNAQAVIENRPIS